MLVNIYDLGWSKEALIVSENGNTAILTNWEGVHTIDDVNEVIIDKGPFAGASINDIMKKNPVEQKELTDFLFIDAKPRRLSNMRLLIDSMKELGVDSTELENAVKAQQ